MPRASISRPVRASDHLGCVRSGVAADTGPLGCHRQLSAMAGHARPGAATAARVSPCATGPRKWLSSITIRRPTRQCRDCGLSRRIAVAVAAQCRLRGGGQSGLPSRLRVAGCCCSIRISASRPISSTRPCCLPTRSRLRMIAPVSSASRCGTATAAGSTLLVHFRPSLAVSRVCCCRARRKYHAVAPEQRCRVPWLTGCCVLLRRDCYEQLAGFDEDFFLYYEDVDLCRRATERGWSVWYEPALTVTHHRPLHARSVPAHLRLFTRHASLTYARKHWPGWHAARFGAIGEIGGRTAAPPGDVAR